MQRLVLVCLAALAAAPSAAVRAQGAGPAPTQAGLRIAFINSREILQRTPG